MTNFETPKSTANLIEKRNKFKNRSFSSSKLLLRKSSQFFNQLNKKFESSNDIDLVDSPHLDSRNTEGVLSEQAKNKTTEASCQQCILDREHLSKSKTAQSTRHNSIFVARSNSISHPKPSLPPSIQANTRTSFFSKNFSISNVLPNFNFQTSNLSVFSNKSSKSKDLQNQQHTIHDDETSSVRSSLNKDKDYQRFSRFRKNRRSSPLKSASGLPHIPTFTFNKKYWTWQDLKKVSDYQTFLTNICLDR